MVGAGAGGAGPLYDRASDAGPIRPTSCRSASRSCSRSRCVNLFLGLFNLLPIPPLDGSALIERVLPGQWLPHWYQFRPYGFLVLFLLVFSTGVISRVPAAVR